MTKILALISLLASPVAIYVVFGWAGLSVVFLAFIGFAFFDFHRFRREEKWRNLPLNQVLRKFGQFNFHTSAAFGERAKTDPVTIVPDTFSKEQREETLYIISRYETLLSQFEHAVKEFEGSLKLRKGSGVSGEEFLIFIDALDEALRGVKAEYSPEFSLYRQHSAFFEELSGKLEYGEDYRGDHRWGSPKKVRAGTRFYRRQGSIDLLHFDSRPSGIFWIAIGAQELDITEFFPDRMDECVARIYEIQSKY